MTLAQFIEKYCILIKTVRLLGRDDVEWSKDARHFQCHVFAYGQNKTSLANGILIDFSQGSAHTKTPTALDVLECLVSDVRTLEAGAFEDWADEYGYDVDSRKAESTYKSIQETKGKLLKWLRYSIYAELMATEYE